MLTQPARASAARQAANKRGGFKTYDTTTDPSKLDPFESWRVDIFHSFNFPRSGTANLP